METLLEYKCPCCGGKVEFDTSSQKMKCPYCETIFDVEALREQDQILQTPEDKLEWKTPENHWQEEEGLRVYSCDSCGGQIVADETTAATHCPYCENPVVMAGNLTGDLKPDCVIPFKLDKKAAKEALKKHMSGKKLVPKLFKSESKLEEIKGVYVPFWLFDADADAQASFKATRLRHWSDRNYNYTETSYFHVRREGHMAFQSIPVDGSEKMPNELMESLEPFDVSQAVPFQTAYLSGYMADKYDVTAESSEERANQRIRSTAKDALTNTVQGYTTVTLEQNSTQIAGGQEKYALYPVWLMTATWHGQRYLFAMNGQTGKMAGNLPMDKGAWRKWYLIYGGSISAVLFLLAWIIGGLL